MKNLSIILACIVVTMISCTKSKEVHPEVGDGNDEIVTVGMKDVHVEYTRTDHAELNRVVFHYCPVDANGNAQQFEAAEMTKKETFFELVLDELLCDTLYWYYYELFPNSGDAFTTAQKTFHTQAFEQPGPPTPPVAELPTIVTMEVSEITSNSAQCGGDVVNDGGEEVTERGICWGTNENPNLNDNHIAVGTGTGVFTVEIDGLQANTTYHVRAYATNEAGTAYGLDREFTTLSGGGSGAPEGAINGLFTINENGDQVYFSQGNLQYQASTNTWRFAENQWNYIGTQVPDGTWNYVGGNVEGSDNYYISENYNGWIDLFNWGTSGYNHGSYLYQPWNTGGSVSSYNAYGGTSYNLFDQTGQADWGYNAIINGGNTIALWRTLKQEEWYYLIEIRQTNSGIRYVKAEVNGVNGLILFPDNWNNAIYNFDYYNQSDVDWGCNTIDELVWRETLQHNGAVFLPAGGFRQRYENQISGAGVAGRYWTASCYSSGYAYMFFFSWIDIWTSSEIEMWFGLSVRLVQDANP